MDRPRLILDTPQMFCTAPTCVTGGFPGVPGQVPVNAGAAAGVNLERPQRARHEDV
jgi:hypothetical protein